MKKIIMALLMGVAVTVSYDVCAKNPMGGGFSGPSVSAVTVKEASKMSDDTPVVLKGKIEKHLGGDRYLFKDLTGTITVDIDDDEWRGLTVTPDDVIEISGEVDKDWTSTEIDVKSIRKVQ